MNRTAIASISLVILCTLIIGFSKPSFSAPLSVIREGTVPSFEVLDRSSGLSNLSVSSIIQDKDGFLWFGTQGGLNRYDGRSFRVYTNDPYESNGLVHNLIQTMFYDEVNNQLWIGTYQGISRLDIGTNQFTNYTVEKNGLSNPVVVSLDKDKEGYIWVGTLDGLNRLNPETGEVTIYGVPGKVIRDIFWDSEGTMWLGSYEGLLYFDATKGGVVSSGYSLPSKSVMTIGEYTPHVLTLGLWDGGITKIDLSTQKMTNKLYNDNRVYSYTLTSDETEWIGTWGGGLYANTKDGRVYHFTSDGKIGNLSHTIVYSLFQDSTGILWVGTNGGGICKVNPLKRNYVAFSHDPEDPSSLDAGKVNAILRDDNGYLWIAVYNEGLNKIATDNVTITKYKADPEGIGTLTDSNVIDILKSKDGTLYFTVGNEVMKYDSKSDQFSTVIKLPDSVITYALESDENDIMWVGTHSDGIYRQDLKTGESQHYKYNNIEHEVSDDLIYDIKFDHLGRLWVATNNGLNLMEKGSTTFKVFKSVQGDMSQLASNTIHVIFEDKQGTMWFGLVGGGLVRYNEDGTFKSYLERDGMPNNVVLGILEGNDGRIWASTQNGLAIVTPTTGDIFVLTPDDGIGGYEFNSGHFADENGTMHFGGIHGITAIPGNINEGELKPPKVYITGVDIFQKPYESNRNYFNGLSLKLKQDETFLGFKFVALDYDSPDKLRFSYRLKGFDTGWIYSGTTDYITYSKLPAGSYTLEVFAETARGVSSDVVSMQVEIAKPWYNTPFAHIGYTIIFGLVVFAVYKIWQGAVIKRRNDELGILNGKLEEANKSLESLSTKDPLTGVYNRRYFNTRLDEELQLAIRSGIEMSLLMLDLDNFKEINDHYGHHYGDIYLEKLGEVLVKSLRRSTDFVVRYGGDEFLIVLFDTGSAGANQLAQNIKDGVEEASVHDVKTNIIIKTTCSIGVLSFIPSTGTHSNQVTKLVDKALYLAKKEGKNRIVAYEGIEKLIESSNLIDIESV
ncbi:ligand-binding sensor domain-containing protein [Fusibacter bizertensis]